LRRENLRLL